MVGQSSEINNNESSTGVVFKCRCRLYLCTAKIFFELQQVALQMKHLNVGLAWLLTTIS